MLPYLLCASTVLLAGVLENPSAPRTQEILLSTASLLQFLQNLETDAGCNFRQVWTAWNKMQKAAQQAVDQLQTGLANQAMHFGGDVFTLAQQNRIGEVSQVI